MSIKFIDTKKMFVIETFDSTYAFAEIDGGLLSAYWGDKLDNPTDIPVPYTGIGRILGDQYFNNKQYNTEYNGWSGKFYSEPTLKVTFADGVRDLDLKYQSYKISQDNNFGEIMICGVN